MSYSWESNEDLAALASQEQRTADGRIVGKVAQLMNQYTLAINRGSRHGVTESMRFNILNSLGTHITDPDTSELLGSARIAKVRVEAYRVFDRFSVCRTYQPPASPLGSSLFAQFATGAQGLTIAAPRETLRLQDKPLEEELFQGESYVKIGDIALQILDSEKPGTRP
jgi:hypothetical protein